ncbi:uncharacterized protein LOC142331470 [Lycorma delicatula]|uniref:uncharacterized protein LOC142331470 n=1 Tax=Lycorma delicatula TaxID=130591 RepID=UPI003F517AE4
MKVPELKDSLCGLKLETGCKIIGFIYLITSFTMFITYARIEYDHYTLRMEVTEEYEKTMNLEMMKVLITIIDAIVGIITSTLLLIGAYKKKPFFLLPWIILRAIFTLRYISISLYKLIEKDVNIYDLGKVTVEVISIYLWLIVYSFYKHLKIQEDGIYA